MRVCVCVCMYCMRIQVRWFMHKYRGKKGEFLAPGLLLGCSYISRKNAVDVRMFVTARAKPKAETSLRWLIINIFPGR